MKPSKFAVLAKFIANHILLVILSILTAALIAAPLAALTLHFGLPVLFPAANNPNDYKDLGLGAAAILLASISFSLFFLIAFILICRHAIRRLDKRLMATGKAPIHSAAPMR